MDHATDSPAPLSSDAGDLGGLDNYQRNTKCAKLQQCGDWFDNTASLAPAAATAPGLLSPHPAASGLLDPHNLLADWSSGTADLGTKFDLPGLAEVPSALQNPTLPIDHAAGAFEYEILAAGLLDLHRGNLVDWSSGTADNLVPSNIWAWPNDHAAGDEGAFEYEFPAAPASSHEVFEIDEFDSYADHGFAPGISADPLPLLVNPQQTLIPPHGTDLHRAPATYPHLSDTNGVITPDNPVAEAPPTHPVGGPRQVNRGTGGHSCSVCGAVIGRRADLRRHQRRHNNTNPLACRFAGCPFKGRRSFTREDKRREHEQTCVHGNAGHSLIW